MGSEDGAGALHQHLITVLRYIAVNTVDKIRKKGKNVTWNVASENIAF